MAENYHLTDASLLNIVCLFNTVCIKYLGSYHTTAPRAALPLLNEISRHAVIPRTIAAGLIFSRKVAVVQILLNSSIKSYH